MELKTKKFNLTLDGEAYELSFPTVSQVSVLDPKTVDIEKVMALVISCGLPKKVVENLQIDHLNAIVEGLMGKNKKS